MGKVFIYKEKRVIKRKIDDKEYTSAYFDYMLMKNGIQYTK